MKNLRCCKRVSTKVEFLDLCMDGMLADARDLYEREKDEDCRQVLLLAKDEQGQRTCLHLVISHLI